MKEEATDHRHACTQQDIWRNALKKEKKKAFGFAISPTFNMLGYKVGGSMGQTEEDY